MNLNILQTQSDQSFGAFVYFVNAVLRSVISPTAIGHLYGNKSLSQWLIRNRFNRVFDLSSTQLLKIDHTFYDSLVYDMVVGHDPFFSLKKNEIEIGLSLIDKARCGALIAIPTREHTEFFVDPIYSVSQWIGILGQIGRVVQIHNNKSWSLFLTLK